LDTQTQSENHLLFKKGFPKQMICHLLSSSQISNEKAYLSNKPTTAPIYPTQPECVNSLGFSFFYWQSLTCPLEYIPKFRILL